MQPVICVRFHRRLLTGIAIFRQNIIKLALVILLGTNILYYTLKNKPETRIVHYIDVSNNVTVCHKAEVDKDLPFADRSFSSPAKSIYFHETSCKGDLDSREACAIESTARAHPQWQINVMFSAPVNKLSQHGGILARLQEFKNVKLFRVHILKFVKDTLLENVITAHFYSNWNTRQAADVLRYLTLFKWGGVCLDLDVVVVNAFDSLAKNWVARQEIMNDNDIINPGVMSLSKDQLGRRMSRLILSELQDFRPSEWNYNGPGAIMRSLRRVCSSTDLNEMSTETCDGLQIYPPKKFFPIHYSRWDLYFKPGDYKTRSDTVITHKIWNRFSLHKKAPNNSRYANLAKIYCPTIYDIYGDDFGI